MRTDCVEDVNTAVRNQTFSKTGYNGLFVTGYDEICVLVLLGVVGRNQHSSFEGVYRGSSCVRVFTRMMSDVCARVCAFVACYTKKMTTYDYYMRRWKLTNMQKKC